MSQISLTVPSDDERALVAAGTFFLTLAGKVPALELDDAPEATRGPTITAIDTVRVAESIEAKLPDEFLQLNDAGEWVDPTAESTEEDTEVADPTAEWKFQDALARAVEAVGDLDANGLPWDARIHAGSKALNKNGTWRYRRGVDEGIVEAVEAELMGLLSTPVAPPPPPAQETTAPPPPAQETTAPPPPAQETTAPPPPVEGMTVPAFLRLVTANIGAKKWTREEIEQAITNQGVPGVEKIPHLMTHQDLIPKVLEELDA